MKKIFFAFALGILIFSSCSQDRLDIPQKGVIALGDFYQTDEDAQMALVAAYDGVATNYVKPLYNDNIIYSLWNYPGDDMYAAGNNKTDNIAQNELNAFLYPTNNQMITVGYQAFFQAIYTANLVIDNFKDCTTPIQKKAVAEAKVLRALSYLQLAIGWGTPPIVDHVLSATEKPANAESQAAVLDFIIKDCQEALPVIDERQSTSDKNGAVKVTKGLANMIMAKAMVWKGDFAGALSALADIINSKKYALVPSEELEMQFHVPGNGSPEKIFELNLVYDSSVTGYSGHSVANMPWLWNWRSDVMTIPNGVGTQMHNNGWGECNPTEKFANALIENDGLDSYRRKAWLKTFDEVLYEMPYSTDGENPVMGKTTFKEQDPKRGIFRASGLYGHCGYFM
ncbi:MAG: RagB/SusD family nutrient uptake outer membrane protein, partial [Bacteroidales bacterium]|nr:RagB/SusD family nutrient uptake outer membrane protein [Bacteroidales bacterium]